VPQEEGSGTNEARRMIDGKPKKSGERLPLVGHSGKGPSMEGRQNSHSAKENHLEGDNQHKKRSRTKETKKGRKREDKGLQMM